MDQLVTANVATNLYWLGRNLERANQTLHKILKAYDLIIDVDRDAGVKLYKTFDIELQYDGAVDFLHQAILGEHRSNILEITANARESAIISRHRIDSEAFGEIIELHALFDSLAKSDIEIDYKLIDKAHSLISEIWGALAKREHTNKSDLFFRMGKLVEEADFRLRFNKDAAVTAMVIEEIDAIVEILGDDEEPAKQTQSQSSDDDLLSVVNSKINQVIVE
ncbi:MAG: kinase [Epsilonproteobacteria bacterium]|nr:MAG: kinase [Campylobacterota bacterium]